MSTFAPYGKWDAPEPKDIVFEKIKFGDWDFERFCAWVNQVQLEEYRNAEKGQTNHCQQCEELQAQIARLREGLADAVLQLKEELKTERIRSKYLFKQ